MSKLHFIGGEKGGVGKSLVARVLAQYLIDHEQPFLGFDTDQSHGALLRFYGDFAAPVAIDRYESLDRIVEAAVAEPERRILVDLAAQTHPFLMRWMEDSGLLDISDELGIELTYWHVMDSGQDAVDLLGQLLDRFNGRLPLILVLNEIRGDRFDLLEASGLRTRAEELGATGDIDPPSARQRHAKDRRTQQQFLGRHQQQQQSPAQPRPAGAPARQELAEPGLPGDRSIVGVS